jgi:hypothetical protein
MDQRELLHFSDLVTADIAAIIHWQQVLAGINEKLNHSFQNPFENDLIMEEHYGGRPAEPRIHEINGVKITTRILHRLALGNQIYKELISYMKLRVRNTLLCS